MRAYFLLALLVAAALLLFVWWFLHTPPQQVARALRRGALALVAAVVILLAATGRLHWVFALIGALVPLAMRLLRLLPMVPATVWRRLFSGLRQQASANRRTDGGQRSSVDTRFLRMTLDHDSGEMSGEVIDGRFRGRSLDELDLGELLDLLDECRADHASATVLETYLERMHPDWRDAEQDTRRRDNAGAAMTEQQAWEILGLKPGASREEVIVTHRRLIQKLHPDRGGSDYLAAQINEAKDILLAAFDG